MDTHDKTATLHLILEKKIVAVIRDISSDRMIPTVQALVDGGILCMEVTFDTGSTMKSEDTLVSIAAIKREFGSAVALGAGTVLRVKHVREAAQAGATYIVSPDAAEEVIRETKRLGLVSMPGALTPTEILMARNHGADIIKLFPASTLGTAYIRSVLNPIRHIPLFAVGGITAENARSYLDAGCAGISAGGNLVDKDLIEAGDYAAIRELALAFTHACENEGAPL